MLKHFPRCGDRSLPSCAHSDVGGHQDTLVVTRPRIVITRHRHRDRARRFVTRTRRCGMFSQSLLEQSTNEYRTVFDPVDRVDETVRGPDLRNGQNHVGTYLELFTYRHKAIQILGPLGPAQLEAPWYTPNSGPASFQLHATRFVPAEPGVADQSGVVQLPPYGQQVGVTMPTVPRSPTGTEHT